MSSNKKKIVNLFIICFFIGMGLQPMSHGDDGRIMKCNPQIDLPTDPVVITVETFPANWNSSFKIHLSGIYNPTDVTNGTYNGWCVEYGVGTNNGPMEVTLRSSYELPDHLMHENWSKVNYILNHKQGDRIDVQRAIWYFINFGPWTWDHVWGPYNGPVTDETLSMIDDANEYGSDWCPSNDQVIAVLCDQGIEWQSQLTFIEVNLTIKNVVVVKSVHYNSVGPWNDTGITIDLSGPHAYDWCTFRINVTNCVDVPLNVTVKDVLPEGLINGNHYYPYYADYCNDSTIIWYLDGVHHDLLQPGQTITFALRAEMGECGVRYMNQVYVTSQAGSSPPIVDIEDAYVEWINCPPEAHIDINQSSFDYGFPIRHTMDGDWVAAQSFTPTLDMISDSSIYLRRFGIPEFDLTVELRMNHPQGTLIDTLVFIPNEVPTSWTWFDLDFSDIPVTPGIQYFIIITPTSKGVSTSFGYEWGYALGNQYDDGSFWFTRDGGVLWRDLPTMYEFAFRTYGYN